MNPKTIDAQIVEEEIVSCQKCGQKNRLYKSARQGVYRCASCRSELRNPFVPRPKSRSSGLAVFGWCVFALILLVGLIALLGSGQSRAPSYVTPSANTSTDNSTNAPTSTTAAQDTELRQDPDGSYSIPTNSLTEGAQRAIASLKSRGIPIDADSVAAEIAREKDDAEPALPTPSNGETLTYTNRERVAPFEIKSTRGSNYLVKLTDAGSGALVLTVFVRGGETVNVDVPLGTFIVKYASGDSWYGYDHLFGENTAYSKASTDFTFDQSGSEVNGYTITLYEVPYGNLQTERIKPNEF